jgi:hypothetical protein
VRETGEEHQRSTWSKGPATKVPRDWKTFLSNDENKTSFTRFLLEEWKKDKYAPKLQGRQVLFVCQEKCVRLTTDNTVRRSGRTVFKP